MLSSKALTGLRDGFRLSEGGREVGDLRGGSLMNANFVKEPLGLRVVSGQTAEHDLPLLALVGVRV